MTTLVIGLILGYLLGVLDEKKRADRILNLYLVAQKNGQEQSKIRLQ